MTTTGGFAAFRSRDFVKTAVVRLLAGGALQMVLVAVGFQIYAETGDPLDLGLVGLAQFGPMATLALPAGQAADRFDRRVVVALCLAAQVLACVGLAIATEAMPGGIAPLYGLLVLVGVARAFYGPALSALTPSTVPVEHLANAMTWSSALWQASAVLGPVVGGALYGLAGGATVVYGAAGAAFALALSSILFVKPRPRATDKRPASLQTALEGLRYVWSRKILLGAISLDFVAVFLGGAPVLLPAFATDVLHVGAAGLGVLRGASAIGAGLMTAYLAARPIGGKVGHVLLGSVAAFGVATLVFGLSESFFLSLFALGCLGAADMVSVVVRQTLVYLHTPDEMRGRVSAVNFVFVGASNELGDVESGVAARLFGLVPAVVIGGVGTLVVTGVWTALFPALRRVDRIDASTR